MKNRTLMTLISMLLLLSGLCPAQELSPIPLPPARIEGGRPLMQVLQDRQSRRSYSPEKLPMQTLSDLMWATFGVNRPESGRRTAPSARNWQEIDVYAALAEGLFLYDAATHSLQPVVAEDLRAATGGQHFVASAPLNLVFVADYARMGDAPEEAKLTLSYADAGFISQNVYLYCASEGLATVVRAMVDRASLSEKMRLRPEQKIIMAQTVGFPETATEE